MQLCPDAADLIFLASRPSPATASSYLRPDSGEILHGRTKVRRPYGAGVLPQAGLILPNLQKIKKIKNQKKPPHIHKDGGGRCGPVDDGAAEMVSAPLGQVMRAVIIG
jgi:hypothetical protein